MQTAKPHPVSVIARHWLTPWLAAIVVCILAALARTYLIQPAEIAQACEAQLTWWCMVRLAIIYTYAWQSIGELAVLLVLLAILIKRAWIAALALAIGAAALVLYCYEPGAFAIVAGALLLARRQNAPSRPWDDATAA